MSAADPTLEELAAEAAQLGTGQAGDAAPGAPGAELAPAAPPEPGNFEAIAFLLAGFREVASMFLKVKSLQRTMNDDNVERCARVLAPVAEKYGLQLGGMLGGPEAAAVMVAGPILWGAWRELDAELSARRGQAEPAPASTSTPANTAPAPDEQA